MLVIMILEAEAESGRLLLVQGQHGTHSLYQAGQGHTAKLHLNNRNRRKILI